MCQRKLGEILAFAHAKCTRHVPKAPHFGVLHLDIISSLDEMVDSCGFSLININTHNAQWAERTLG